MHVIEQSNLVLKCLIFSSLRGLTPWSLTRIVIMDSLDWFAPDSKEAEEEVNEFYRVLVPGGLVFWRSAAKKPWYAETYV